MTKLRYSLMILAVISFALLSGFEGGGCGDGLQNRPGEPAIDVGGVQGAEWKLKYSDIIQVTVKNAAGVVANYNLSRAAGGTFSLAGEVVDLREVCDRGEVTCPDEIFPGVVKMTQPGMEGHLLYVDYAMPNQDGKPVSRTLLGNVDSDRDISIALGVGLGGGGACGLLSVSYFNGHVNDNGGDPPIGATLQGDIVTAYSGTCLLAGKGGLAAGALTVEIRIPAFGDRLM